MYENKEKENWCMKKKNKVIIIIEKLFLIADLDQNMQKHAYLIEMS